MAKKNKTTDCLSITEAILLRQESVTGGFPSTAGCQSQKPVPSGFEHCVRPCSACSFTLVFTPPPPAAHFPPASVHFTSKGKQTSNVIPLLFARKPTTQVLTLA